MATPYFYKKISTIANEERIPLIINEDQTGVGVSGKNWAYQLWNLEEQPDIVIFGGRAQVHGFYAKE